ncbi:MAG: hypothetical protein HRU14_17335 [Planctomycetes bacterium]|nr:hypothetical protein [Planctomycetota bacterium]
MTHGARYLLLQALVVFLGGAALPMCLGADMTTAAVLGALWAGVMTCLTGPLVCSR